jgi:DNA helicase-2/ATP-dependent DNA helicase PcrA
VARSTGAERDLMRAVAEFTQAKGRVPTDAEVARIFDEDFFLPAANKAAHRQLKAAAQRLVAAYKRDHEDDLQRVWETERPFELHLEGVIVSGRADVILDKEDGVPTALAIVDYKTSTHGEIGEHALQLQVYADAGRREGLDVRAAYVHNLAATRRDSVPVDPVAVAEAEGVVTDAAVRLRAREYRPSPGQKCRRCEVRTVCPSALR